MGINLEQGFLGDDESPNNRLLIAPIGIISHKERSKKMSIESSSHTKYELKYHFAWCSKYRWIVLAVTIGKYVAKVIYEVAERYDF